MVGWCHADYVTHGYHEGSNAAKAVDEHEALGPRRPVIHHDDCRRRQTSRSELDTGPSLAVDSGFDDILEIGA